MKVRMILILVLIVLIVLIVVLVFWANDLGSSGSDRYRESEGRVGYKVSTVVSYRNRPDYFSSQTDGFMFVDKRENENGEMVYDYLFNSYVSVNDNSLSAQIILPSVEISRDIESDRFVGGNSSFRDLGLLANLSLDKVRGKSEFDGSIVRRVFKFKASDKFPFRVAYSLVFTRQKLESKDDAVLVLATSDSFHYNDPESGNMIMAEHRVLCLMNAEMNEVYFMFSNFRAYDSGKENGGVLKVESLMHQLQGSNPISLKGLDEKFGVYLDRMGLDKVPIPYDSNSGLPVWAMHSLAIHGAVSQVAGAAIEGRPNFVICATIGLTMMVDSGVTAATSLLSEAGVIDWEWKGISNYVGRGVGFAAANGYEKMTGKSVDKAKWKDVGGVAGDIASVFIPYKSLEVGVKAGSSGVRILRARKTVNTSLTIYNRGKKLVDAVNEVREAVNVKKEDFPYSFGQVKGATREEMVKIASKLDKLSQAYFDVLDREFLRLLFLKVEHNAVLKKVVKAMKKVDKLSNKEFIELAEKAAHYDSNLMVLYREGVMSWEEVLRRGREKSRK